MRALITSCLFVFSLVACSSSDGESTDTSFPFDIDFGDSAVDVQPEVEADAPEDVQPDVPDEDIEDVEQDVATDAPEDVQPDVPEDVQPDVPAEVIEDVAAVDAEDVQPDAADADTVDADDQDAEEDVTLDIDVDIPDPADVDVSINVGSILPFFAIAEVGDVVRFTNRDVNPRHIVFFDESFDSGELAANDFVDFTPTLGGTFLYGEFESREVLGHVVVLAPGLEGDHYVNIDLEGGAAIIVPNQLTILAGETVVFENLDFVRPRALRANDESFFSGTLTETFRYAFTFTEPGDVLYALDGDMSVAAQIQVLAPPPEADHTISMGAASFEPSSVEMVVGETLVFVNNDNVAHSAISVDDTLDTGRLEPGAWFLFTATTAGSLRFSDAVGGDRMYTGRLTITEAE
ncbi:MAG: plastocyanin [Bradymonadia bacterium]|jgi:plastocyanin